MTKLNLLIAVCLFLIPLSVTAAQDEFTCPDAPPIRLSPDSTVRVLPAEANNLRAEPSINAEIVGQIPPYAVFNIIGEPVCADGYVWWNTVYLNGVEGWTAEGVADAPWLETYLHPDPVELFTPEDTKNQDVVDVDYHGVKFSISRDLAAWVVVDHAYPNYISAADSSPEAGTPTPDGLVFRLLNEDGSSQMLVQVYAIEDFANLPDGLPQTITDLGTLVANEGELNPVETYPDTDWGILPGWISPLLFQDAYRYINFQNGRGFSYFAAYSFDVYPIGVLTYTFTGVTHDGQFYVTVQHDVMAEAVPVLDALNFTPEDWEDFNANFEAYSQQIAADLVASTPDQFTPNLDVLDALIMSLNVQPDAQDQ